MKKTLLSLLAMCAPLAMSAQQLSTVCGKFASESSIPTMHLYEVVNGQCEELASSKVGADGAFAFAFYPKKEGFYVVGRNGQSDMNRYVFYLKPGDNACFQVNGDNYELTGKNTKENQVMAKWHEAIYPVESKGVYFMGKNSTFRDFFPEMERLAPQLENYPKAKTGNAKFDAAFEDFKLYNLYDVSLMYLNTPRTEHPTTKDYIDFYKKMSIASISKSTSLLDYPNGIAIIPNVKLLNYRCDASLTTKQLESKFATYMDDAVAETVNPTIKGELVLLKAKGIKTYPGILDYRDKNESFLVNDSQKARMRDIVAKLDKNEKGSPAPIFNLPDTEGKMHSLKDYRGKVVYIDFWATWCGPCKREIPYMTKLEEEYAGNTDIVFISVSTDKEADKQKWLDMVKEKGMKGVQLFTGDLKDQISNPYHINAIPRFVLIDRNGNLVNGDAPRPSSDEIRPLINYLLKKK